ncbi:MAG: DUF6514 family protein [Clostridium sp.]|nr:DUF6514 family protein [Clostridium sp.]MCM1547009.1 DUF6514 family protein [Ruminococcus sp.]
MYKIIKTSISTDKRRVYSIYRYKAEIDGKYIVTYGVAAANTTECSRVNEISFDEDTAFNILNCVSENSVTVSKLKDFVIDYLDKL